MNSPNLKMVPQTHGRVSWRHAGATILLFIGFSVLVLPAHACGYEDPQSVATGALNFAFPDSLHVGTAIWQAQMEGFLPREVRSSSSRFMANGIAARDQVTADALVEKLGMMAEARNALRLIDEARGQLAYADNMSSQAPLAVVFASKMFWTRFMPSAQGLSTKPHVTGPESGDVVLVTDALVLQALLSRTMSLDDAFARGVLRLYGDATAVHSARGWLAALQVQRGK